MTCWLSPIASAAKVACARYTHPCSVTALMLVSMYMTCMLVTLAGSCYLVAHSGSGLSAVMAEQQQPGTFKAMYLYEPVVLGPLSTGEDTWAYNASMSRPWPFFANPAMCGVLV